VKSRDCKVVVLGDSGVGKTAIIHRLTDSEYRSDFKATIGFNFSTFSVECENLDVKLQIWDTAGEERFFALNPQFYRGIEACVLVFDITNARSLARIDDWQRDALEKAGVEDPEHFPFVVFGNKSDLRDTPGAIPAAEAQRVIGQKGIPFFEVSAKSGQGIEAGFRKVAELCLEAHRRNVSHVPLGLPPVEAGGGGCCT
jgi:Ras-related protein Rab-7A